MLETKQDIILVYCLFQKWTIISVFMTECCSRGDCGTLKLKIVANVEDFQHKSELLNNLAIDRSGLLLHRIHKCYYRVFS